MALPVNNTFTYPLGVNKMHSVSSALSHSTALKIPILLPARFLAPKEGCLLQLKIDLLDMFVHPVSYKDISLQLVAMLQKIAGLVMLREPPA